MDQLRLVVAAILLQVASLPGHCHAGSPKGPHPGTPACPWAGVYPTVVTPFCDHGVDVPSLEKQLRYQLSHGVHGLLVLGTMGEGQYVTWEERAVVIETAVRVAGARVPVVVGIHTANLDTARIQVQQARDLGAAAVIVKYIPGHRVCGAEVLAFYSGLSDLQLLPIIYYHYPSQTGVYLPPRDIAAILSLPGVAGIKESTLDLLDVQAHMRLVSGQGKVFMTATALNLTQFLHLGGHGAMCAEAVLLPGPTVQAYTAFVQGRPQEARAVQEELFQLLPILRSTILPVVLVRTVEMKAQDCKVPLPMGTDHPQARLKAALSCLGVPTSPAVKHPLPPLTAWEEKRVRSTVQRIKSIDWSEASLREVPPILWKVGHAAQDQRGLLLKTGAFLLGPGVGKDLLRSQGDGHSGF